MSGPTNRSAVPVPVLAPTAGRVVRASEHLSVEEIRAAFERGLAPAHRFQWVEHLGGLCPECLAVLEPCAEQAQEWISADQRRGLGDPVLLALARLLETIWDGLSSELEDSSSLLWWALREARSVPLGFCRLIVEESRFQTRSLPMEKVDLVEQALVIVKRSELAVHGPRLHQDVIARAYAYRGQVLVRRCQHIEAQRAFADAERHLRRGTGDRELEATLWEFRAIMVRDQLDPVRSGRLLEKAVALLRDLPGHERHLAVVLIEKADRLSEQGDCAGARKDYFEAMRLLPGGRYPRLRLRVEHNLAVDEFQNGDPDAA
ncbi:MAG: hypothetical protein GY856_11975, partial [bacterium]|nr:hypothetical protein [bacterium]